jgi:quercetin dioxygenase-like cupin family protein
MPAPYQPFAFEAGRLEPFDLTLLAKELMKDEAFQKSGRVARTLARADQLTAVLTVIRKNAEIHGHANAGPVMVTVLSGSLKFVFDESRDELPLRTGSAVVLSKDVSHRVRALEDSAFVIVVGGRDEA